MKYKLLTTLILFGSLISATLAQGTPILAIELAEEKVNLSTGESSGETETIYLPGDTIRYILVASNEGDGVMTQPEVLDPIPAGVRYISGSAQGENTRIIYSIDQGSSYSSWPVPYTVRNTNGVEIIHEASADMITHIKWQLQGVLQPGDSRRLQFMVEVN